MIGYLLNIGLYAKCKGLGIIPKSPGIRTAAVLAILSNLNILRYNALPLSQKQGRIFFENLPCRYLRFDEEMSVVK